MDLEGAIRARLIADAAVAAIVGTQVSWDERPQEGGLPAITMTIIDDQRRQHFGATERVQRALVQVDVWAKKSTERGALRIAVAEALEPAVTAVGVKFQRGFLESSRGGGEGATGGFVYRQSMDFRFTFSEA